jgi:hypothetical protein
MRYCFIASLCFGGISGECLESDFSEGLTPLSTTSTLYDAAGRCKDASDTTVESFEDSCYTGGLIVSYISLDCKICMGTVLGKVFPSGQYPGIPTANACLDVVLLNLANDDPTVPECMQSVEMLFVKDCFPSSLMSTIPPMIDEEEEVTTTTSSVVNNGSSRKTVGLSSLIVFSLAFFTLGPSN